MVKTPFVSSMKQKEREKRGSNPTEDQFRRVAIRRGLIDAVEDFVEQNPHAGYKSVADFVQEAVRLRIQEIGKLYNDLSS